MYAHDQTIDKFPDTNHTNIHFFKVGIGAANKNYTKTLNNIIRDNNHKNRIINYLKVHSNVINVKLSR